jgi:hypothetical protein
VGQIKIDFVRVQSVKLGVQSFELGIHSKFMLRSAQDPIGAFLLALLGSRYSPFQAPLGPLVFLSSLISLIQQLDIVLLPWPP